MTGILPIKKYGTESALTDFREYTMTKPGWLAKYVGFTEDEVKGLCEEYQMDFEEVQTWYDGYSFSRVKHVYSPNSVMSAVQEGEILNYWPQTESSESLKEYIEMDYDGLKGDEDMVAEALEIIHESVTSVLQYNDEASLSCAITIAYYTAKRYYSIVRELPSGKGFADLAFIPRRGVGKPAMIVELKYEKDADTAIRQIHDNRYGGVLKDCFGNLLLVGINYDKNAAGEKAKKHGMSPRFLFSRYSRRTVPTFANVE